jgi:hypothetical protein
MAGAAGLVDLAAVAAEASGASTDQVADQDVVPHQVCSPGAEAGMSRSGQQLGTLVSTCWRKAL